MIVINCTKKLLKRLHYEAPSVSPESTNLLGAWCANVFNISRFPFVLVTNEKTLLSILFPLKEFKNFNLHFINSLNKQLKELKVPERIIATELHHASEIVLATNTNRSILGSMNELVYHVKSMAYSRDSFTAAELERELRNIPYSPIKFRYPGEAVQEMLKMSSTA